jgi:hypothetical protein
MAAKLKIEKRGDEILIVHCWLAHGRWFSPGTPLPRPLNLVAMMLLKYC